MLWNSPSFSFLEIANIKHQFEICRIMNRTTKFQPIWKDVGCSRKFCQSVWPRRQSFFQRVFISCWSWSCCSPEEGVWHPYFASFHHRQVPGEETLHFTAVPGVPGGQLFSKDTFQFRGQILEIDLFDKETNGIVKNFHVYGKNWAHNKFEI